MAFPSRVRIVEVGPRDGLQNEAAQVPTGIRLELIDRLGEAGLRTIEAGSFVSPRWVPQMTDTADLVRRLKRRPGVAYPVLVPNEKGLDAALAAGADEIAVFAAASQAFSRKNINCSVEESLARFAPVLERALANGIRVRGYVSCVLGCPYQGDVAVADVVRVAGELTAMGCYEISLGDTIGVGTPLAARRLVDAVSASIPLQHVAVHFHDTYGQALANIFACLERGVSVVDSSIGGLGGCPYAKGATGNVATEDVVYMLQGMGVETGVSLDRLIETSLFIARALGRAPRSHLAMARTAG
ncbi:hydroxymethylglutaryl-CoA lyase [Roseiarcus fermentans]|uniref:hydroxymethylglutaryl-CoA lyase n=1 Tax=Roseiarcus fermentans TaxID=1473586 RepID=A0A366FU32_9HYPH|nr:hydroxymethylglutaryl-CoA lyase [Roseiarcus fermentans]RBP18194.1 hydroxymethylglutaryl-CoA lyase [Roseiarcus fermentans]